MEVELQEQLEKKYPTLFKMPCYIECGGGWYKILDELFEKISKNENVILAQVKEKWGQLRIYIAHDSEFLEVWPIQEEEIFFLVEAAEKKSLKVCEFCGKKGKPQNTSWVKVLCNKCADKHFHKEVI